MNKDQVLQALTDHGYDRVQFRKLPNTQDELPSGEVVSQWVVRGILRDGDVATGQNFLLYQYPNGEFYWQERDPFATPTSTPFADAIASFIEDEKTAKRIVRVDGVQVDSTNEQARARVVVADQDGLLSDETILIEKDDIGTLRYRTFKSVAVRSA